MGKFLQKYGILFFFCAMMGGIIMVDSILPSHLLIRNGDWQRNFQITQ